MRAPSLASFEAKAQTTAFRAVVAAALLVLHLGAAAWLTASRFGLPWNRAPHEAPALEDPAVQQSPSRWNRLAVSRWDSEHYINLALRGYRYCPADMIRGGRLPSPTMTCDLAFYPGYAVLGWAASLGGRLPIDYALLGISLAAAWVLLFLWTGPEIAGALGVLGAYVSLVVFNAFTTGFTLVTLQTEPAVLACTLGAFVLLQRRRRWLAALVAGAATGLRVSGVAVSLAFAAALAVEAFRDRPRGAREWLALSGLTALSGWGLALTMGYHAVVFHDPFLYVHAHALSYGHQPSLMKLLFPQTAWLLRSMDSFLHEGIWLFAIVLWIALGHRTALRGFAPSAQAFWYALAAGVLGVSCLGSVSRSFVGMNRYSLLVLPAFFAAGKLLERRPLALSLWLAAGLWHYWNVDLCFYVGDRGPDTFRRCHAAQCVSK